MSELEQITTSSLVPYARNSRTHSDEQIAQIMASIREFGFCNPVLIDEAGMIIAGHGRVMAATRMQLETVPCLRLSHLTDAQKRAYVIADNRIALSSSWDDELLANELSDLYADEFDMALLGFDAMELETLLNIEMQVDCNDDIVADIDTQYDGSPKGVRAVVVHFRDEHAVKAFQSALNVELSDKAKYLWFPEHES